GDFRRDGTFALSRTGRPLEGRYAYANGLLWLIVKEGLVAGRPAWQGKDRFCLKLGGAELVFDRRPVKHAGTGKATATALSLRAGLGRIRPRRPHGRRNILVARSPSALTGRR